MGSDSDADDIEIVDSDESDGDIEIEIGGVGVGTSRSSNAKKPKNMPQPKTLNMKIQTTPLVSKLFDPIFNKQMKTNCVGKNKLCTCSNCQKINCGNCDRCREMTSSALEARSQTIRLSVLIDNVSQILRLRFIDFRRWFQVNICL